MTTELWQVITPILTILGLLIAAGGTFLGAKRGAKATERVSLDDLTKELIDEYRTMKQELRTDLESRLENEREERQRLLENEREDRKRMEEALENRFNELLANSLYLEKYVLWCVGGHAPPPQEVPHKALEKLKRLYPKG